MSIWQQLPFKNLSTLLNKPKRKKTPQPSEGPSLITISIKVRSLNLNTHLDMMDLKEPRNFLVQFGQN